MFFLKNDINFLSTKYEFLKLYSTGVYKSQEARLMLHIYLIKGPSHTSASKLKEEKWAMDGFVSIFLLQKRGIFFGMIEITLVFTPKKS